MKFIRSTSNPSLTSRSGIKTFIFHVLVFIHSYVNSRILSPSLLEQSGYNSNLSSRPNCLLEGHLYIATLGGSSFP